MALFNNTKPKYWWQPTLVADYRNKFVIAVTNIDLLEYQERKQSKEMSRLLNYAAAS